MRRREAIIATSKLCADGYVLAPEALAGMVQQINSQYIPIMVEHDPRIPPFGRLVQAELVNFADGIVAVKAVQEFFEPGDEIPPLDTGRQLAIPSYEPGSLHVVYDGSYSGGVEKSAINEIAMILGTEPIGTVKRALEPISVLIIAGGLALGGVATGFLNALGADAYNALKHKIISLFARKRTGSEERLLVFDFTLSASGREVAAKVVLTNPSAADIEFVLSSGLAALDRILPQLFSRSDGLKKIVVQASDGRLTILYGIREDGVGMFLQGAEGVSGA